MKGFTLPGTPFPQKELGKEPVLVLQESSSQLALLQGRPQAPYLQPLFWGSWAFRRTFLGFPRTPPPDVPKVDYGSGLHIAAQSRGTRGYPDAFKWTPSLDSDKCSSGQGEGQALLLRSWVYLKWGLRKSYWLEKKFLRMWRKCHFMTNIATMLREGFSFESLLLFLQYSMMPAVLFKTSHCKPSVDQLTLVCTLLFNFPSQMIFKWSKRYKGSRHKGREAALPSWAGKCLSGTRDRPPVSCYCWKCTHPTIPSVVGKGRPSTLFSLLVEVWN